MPEISVIVPVFRVEPYLRCCVDSVLAQDFIDFELIFVDDGSDDGCPQIIDEYKLIDKRVCVIHQENMGLSAARNAGLDIAKGNYITFIDSDDAVAKDYLSLLYQNIKKYDADISGCCFDSIAADELEPTASNAATPQIGLISCREALLLRYAGKGNSVYFSPSSCAKLFKHSVIGTLRFPVGMMYEDQLFTSLAFYKADKFSFCSSELYFYRERPNSITRSDFNANRFDNIALMNTVIAFYNSAGDSEMAKPAAQYRDKVLALYTLCAKKKHIDIPRGMHMCPIKALHILYKSNTVEKFEWYLSEFFPHLFSFYRTIHRIFK